MRVLMEERDWGALNPSLSFSHSAPFHVHLFQPWATAACPARHCPGFQHLLIQGCPSGPCWIQSLPMPPYQQSLPHAPQPKCLSPCCHWPNSADWHFLSSQKGPNWDHLRAQCGADQPLGIASASRRCWSHEAPSQACMRGSTRPAESGRSFSHLGC